MTRPTIRDRISVRHVVVCVYAACVVAASVAAPPSNGLSALGPLGVAGLDKWIHAGAYAAMGFGAAAAGHARTRRALLYAVGVAALVGGGVEAAQWFLPYRSFSPVDAAANAVGATVGAGAWALVTARRRGRRRT